MEKIPVARLIYIDDMMYNCKDGSRNFTKGGGGGGELFWGGGVPLGPVVFKIWVVGGW